MYRQRLLGIISCCYC